MSNNGDFSWLAQRVGKALYALSGDVADIGEPELARLVDGVGAGIVCEPTEVRQAKHALAEAGSTGGVIALIGWPTGRHHSLIKAAEARLAVEDGADEVWVAVDTDRAAEVNAVLADIIAVSQVVEEPTRFGVTIPASAESGVVQEIAVAAGKAGANGVAVGVDKLGHVELPAVNGGLAVHGAVSSLDAVADLLLAGADRVFPAAG